ncbi:MAG: LLM class flavin-dependent oxidoreductase [Candidatus Nanopelagicales bacterium]
MRVGVVVLPDLPWVEARRRWLAVESLGFDHGWTYDHLAWRTLADGPWYGAVPMLSAAAAVTSTLRLGTFVANPNFRHPVPFAKELMTLDDISDGRVSLGVGAGGMGYDYTVLGGEPLTLGQRSARFREFVEILDQLLTQPVTNFEGSYYQAVDARMIPGCVQQPRIPFLIAANGPKMMKVAAQYGQGWITTGDFENGDGVAAWWAGVETNSRRMGETLEEAGRSSEGFDKVLHLDASGEYSLQSVDYFEDCMGRAAEAGFTDVVVHYPRPEGLYAGKESILEAIAPSYVGDQLQSS